MGTRVCIRIKGVPRKPVEERDPKVPLIVHGLLQHEHKQSVLHFAVQRNTEYEEPVRAKVSFVDCIVALVGGLICCFMTHTLSLAGPPRSLCWTEKVQDQPSLLSTYSRWWQGKQQCPQERTIPSTWWSCGGNDVWTDCVWKAELLVAQGIRGPRMCVRFHHLTFV